MVYFEKMKAITQNRGCRICKSSQLTKILKFGPQPLANAFLKKPQLQNKEPFYPLDVYFCRKCHLVQLKDIVSPSVLFNNYVYVSSTSSVFIKHFTNFAANTIKRFNLSDHSLVIDIGSNDGILLKPYAKRGIKVLGIEPAENIARLARKDGIDTISDFFNSPLVKKIKYKYGNADVIAATNVFAHINDIDEIAQGVRELLQDNGVFIIEAPYLVDFLEKNLFDTVYHEHLSYYALSPLVTFFAKHNMRVFDVVRVATHGGSLRVFVKKYRAKYKISPNVQKLLMLEKLRKLNLLSTYHEFAKRVEKNKFTLIKLLNKLKKINQTIAGYGAPAKGNTLLNYFGITTKYLDYIVDDSVYKQKLYTPGTRIPVVSPKELDLNPPDYILILAWNFSEAIIKKYTDLKNQGVKFIIPVPKPQII